MRAQAAENAKMFTEKTMAEAAAIYADGPTRNTQRYKDPRGYAEFVRMLSEHAPQGHALTMAMLQSKRPTLWDMEADLRKFSVPLLVICGDEDETCLDGSVFLKRTAPTAALFVVLARPKPSCRVRTWNWPQSFWPCQTYALCIQRIARRLWM